MLNDRRMNVLSALVREYVASVQPVGSRVLVERYGLGCSPATVRSELSALEETGYVFQPHVSAGRIPTEAGYRMFVDEVIAERQQGLDPAEALGVRQRYGEADREIGELLRETSTLLSQLTSYVAVVAAPTLRRARIRRLTLVPLGAQRALVVLVTDSGQVANRPIEFGADVDAAVLARVEASLGGALDGAVADVADTLRAESAGASGPEVSVMLAVLDAVVELLAEADEDRVLTGGVSALLAHQIGRASCRERV